MKNKYLSRAEKEYGSRLFLKHCTFNGFGISFLGDTLVFLMAIYFGASNIQLGYISSVMHMSGIILVILPSLLSGINIIKVQYRAWLLRGLLCLLYGLLFFLSGQTAVIFILAIYTMFCVARMFGMAVAEPIQQMLTTPSNVGEFVISITNRFHFSRLLSYFISFLILSIKIFAGLPGLLIAVFIGIINNTLAAYYLKKIPATIGSLEQRIKTLQRDTSADDFYNQPYEKTQPVLDELQQAHVELEKMTKTTACHPKKAPIIPNK